MKHLMNYLVKYMMKHLTKILLTSLTAALLLGSGTAAAHHSFSAVFQENVERQISGVLTKVEWINPHSFFYVDVTGADGKVTTWSFENFPPIMLRSLGLQRKTLTDQIGSKVTVWYYPTRIEGKAFGYGRVFDFEGGPRVVFTAPAADASSHTPGK